MFFIIISVYIYLNRLFIFVQICSCEFNHIFWEGGGKLINKLSLSNILLIVKLFEH